jgi:hypothetical protein
MVIPGLPPGHVKSAKSCQSTSECAKCGMNNKAMKLNFRLVSYTRRIIPHPFFMGVTNTF